MDGTVNFVYPASGKIAPISSLRKKRVDAIVMSPMWNAWAGIDRGGAFVVDPIHQETLRSAVGNQRTTLDLSQRRKMLRISGDGNWLGMMASPTVGSDSFMRLYYLKASPPISIPLGSYFADTTHIQDFALSPVDTHTLFVGAAWDGQLLVLNLNELSSSPIELMKRKGRNPVFSLIFSPDGTRLAAGLQNGRINYWSVSSVSAPGPAYTGVGATGIKIKQLAGEINIKPTAQGHKFVNYLRLSPTGKYLVAQPAGDHLQLWRWQGKKFIDYLYDSTKKGWPIPYEQAVFFWNEQWVLGFNSKSKHTGHLAIFKCATGEMVSELDPAVFFGRRWMSGEHFTTITSSRDGKYATIGTNKGRYVHLSLGQIYNNGGFPTPAK